MSEAGVYRPLDDQTREIRVLIITSTKPVRGSFEYVSLDNDPIYDTISWCWGDPNPSEVIEVDGKVVKIPRNALEVLQELCIGHHRFRIWLDAVCINQEDFKERGQQVAIMGDIFSKSRQTLVWLGKDDGRTEDAIVAIKDLDTWRKISANGEQSTERMEQVITTDLERQKDFFPMDVDWPTVLSFFSADWFGRFWIIQEVVLSNEVVLFRGTFSVPWPLVSVTATYIVANISATGLPLGHVIKGLAEARAITRVGDITNYLYNDQELFDATDPRDRAFALYGLLGHNTAHAELRKAFQPDYTKSLRQVYIDITRAAIQHTDSHLTVILSAQQKVPRIGTLTSSEGFPSWVPRYDYVSDTSRGAYSHVRWNGPGACKYSNIDYDLNTSDGILRVVGVVVGRIFKVIPPIQNTAREMVSDDVLQTLANLWQTIIRLNTQISEADLTHSVQNTLTMVTPASADKTHEFQAFVAHHWLDPKPSDGLNKAALGDDSADFHFEFDDEAEDDVFDLESSLETGEEVSDEDIVQDWLSIDTSSPDPHDTTNDTKDAMNFYADMLRLMVNRPFVFDEQGRLGSGGRGVQTDDLICILSGVPVPVLLRPVGEQYSFVSDLYLHGIMDVRRSRI